MPRKASKSKSYKKTPRRTYKKRTYRKSSPKRTYKKRYFNPGGTSAAPYSRRNDPSYATSAHRKVSKPKKQAVMSTAMRVGHFSETIPAGTPNRNHWRMLVMAPAHVMDILAKFPQLGKYSQCRIPDFQVGDSVLLPAVTKGSFTAILGGSVAGAAASTTGTAVLFFYPSLEIMVESPTLAGTGSPSLVPTATAAGQNTPLGTNSSRLPYVGSKGNRSYQDVYAAGPLARCVGFCVEIQCLDSSTNASGRIGIVNIPADPYNTLPTTTIDDLANQPSALVVKGLEGCHMSWLPDCNVTSYRLGASVNLYNPITNLNAVFEHTWRYQQFQPNGRTTQGSLASTNNHPTGTTVQTDAYDYLTQGLMDSNVTIQTDATTTIKTPTIPTNGSMRLRDMLPCIMVVVDGAAANSQYSMNYYSHWEVVPNTRGKLAEPGATGQHAVSG